MCERCYNIKEVCERCYNIKEVCERCYNIKEVCERFYNSPTGSRYVLASDKGPSCTRNEQVQNKKVYFIPFLNGGNEKNEDMSAMASRAQIAGK